MKMTLLAGFAAVLLAGCGRKGDLDVPGVYDAQGRPVHTTNKQPAPNRPFVLDPLIQ